MVNLKRTGSCILAFILTLYPIGVCVGEPLLVVTEGRSAQHVATGSYLHGVDFERGLSSRGMLISDQGWNSVLSFNHERDRVASVGMMESGRLSWAGTRTERYPVVVNLELSRVGMPVYSMEEDVAAHFWGYDPALDRDLLCTVYRGVDKGRLTYRVGEKRVSIGLSGVPVAAIPSLDGDTAVVLMEDPVVSGFSVQLCELGGKRRIGKATGFRIREHRFGVKAEAMLISDGGRYLYVAFSGYAIGHRNGERSSWIEVMDLEASVSLEEPLGIEGTLYSIGDSMVAGEGDSCWVASHTAGRSYGYATHVGVEEGILETHAALTFSGVDSAIRIAVSLGTGRTALGVGDEVILYDDEDVPYGRHRFDDVVGALHWSSDGLVLGLGNRVVEVDEDTWEFGGAQDFGTGIVRSIVANPKLAGVDSGVTAPRWVRRVVFRGDMIGSERLVVGPPGVEMKALASPNVQIPSWLLLNPSESGEVGDTLSISPAAWSREASVSGRIMVPMTMAKNGTSGETYETLYQVQVEPSERSRSSILWVRNPVERAESVLSGSRMNPFARLVEQLGGYPYLFHHSEVVRPGEVELAGFSAVILTSASAEYGIYTRQMLLDYVAGGGTIVYMLNAATPLQRDAGGRWLEALGIQVATESKISGIYEGDSEQGFMRHWNDVELVDGLGIRTTDRNSVLAWSDSGEDTAVAVSRTYGLGRVMVFASSTPFENRALGEARGLRLVESVFREVADAASSRSDLDGDGIPDSIEDSNRNGKCDPGETHFAMPDSDGDGIFDGIEDFNQNGFVDDIETNPLLADTDADGVLDAADRHPLPPSGAPYISSIEPGSMPAEGSGTILIAGRNFSANSQVWFGDWMSPDVRLLNRSELRAVVPPQVAGGDAGVDVEIRDSDFEIASKLEKGFRYEDRSSVDLVLKSMSHMRIQYGIYQLTASATLADSPIRLNRASVIVEAQPREAIEYLGVVAGEAISGDRERMQVTVLGQGRLRVTFDEPNRFKGGQPLFEIQCRLNLLTKPSTVFYFRVAEKEWWTPYEGVVDSDRPSELYYNFGSTGQLPLFQE